MPSFAVRKRLRKFQIAHAEVYVFNAESPLKLRDRLPHDPY
ncbi:MAG: hypothetical protein JWR87_1529 [Segetibacter sp.]|jgi:hypothetical protein|nr:hypothetical protein [Segetibacter sp.]